MVLLVGARLGDITGRRRVFRAGVAGFAAASLACALAPSAAVLIGLRVVQGAAAGLVIPQTIGLIRAMFDGAELARAFGSIGPVMGLAAVSGPVLGGVLTHADLFGSSWRAVFLVNVPLAIVVLALSGRLSEDRAPTRPRLDPGGIAFAAAGTVLIVYPLIRTPSDVRAGWSWPTVAAGVLVLAGFAGQQYRRARVGRATLVEPGLFTTRAFPAALVASTLFFAVMNGLMLIIVVYLQLGVGTSALDAGLSLLPWSAGLALASWTAGAWLIRRYGHRVMYVGLGVELAGLVAAICAFHAAGAGTYPNLLAPALFVTGVGIGLFTATFFTAALQRVRSQENGSAAGLLNAVQQLGATLGVAVLGSVYFTGTDALHAIEDAFTIAGALIITAAIPVVLMTCTRRDRPR